MENIDYKEQARLCRQYEQTHPEHSLIEDDLNKDIPYASIVEKIKENIQYDYLCTFIKIGFINRVVRIIASKIDINDNQAVTDRMYDINDLHVIRLSEIITSKKWMIKDNEITDWFLIDLKG